MKALLLGSVLALTQCAVEPPAKAPPVEYKDPTGFVTLPQGVTCIQFEVNSMPCLYCHGRSDGEFSGISHGGPTCDWTKFKGEAK